jgi:hypothetical protein
LPDVRLFSGETNEREIAHWEARTTETEKVALELTLCLEAIDKINQLWDISEDEDKQGMARNLFSYVVYNMDTQRIVDFRLKPWADRFITLRAAFYDDNKDDVSGSTMGKGVAPTGARPSPRYFTMRFAVRRVRNQRILRPEVPEKTLLRARVQQLREQGMSYPQIAESLRISVGTAWNMINGQ